jgi:hypothetical protein
MNISVVKTDDKQAVYKSFNEREIIVIFEIIPLKNTTTGIIKVTSPADAVA